MERRKPRASGAFFSNELVGQVVPGKLLPAVCLSDRAGKLLAERMLLDCAECEIVTGTGLRQVQWPRKFDHVL